MFSQYAEIVPLQRLPRKLGFFDYKVPEELSGRVKIGQMVIIQFRKTRVHGLIINLKSSTEAKDDKLKQIIKILDEEPILEQSRIKFLLQLADEYLISPGVMFRHALPEIPQKKSKLLLPLKKQKEDFYVTKNSAEEITKIINQLNNENKLVAKLENNSIACGTILKLAQKAIIENKSLLILFPVRELAVSFYDLLQKHGLVAHVSLPTDSKNKTHEDWFGFKNNKFNILIGTPAATFFPMPNNGYYVIFDELAEEWKQSETNPRLNILDTIDKLKGLLHAKLLILTPCQSVNSFFSNNPFIDTTKTQPPRVQIVDLNDHIKSGNKNILSDIFYDELRGKKNALIFIHRKGRAARLSCKDCGNVITCKKCELPLAVHRTFMRCVSCEEKTELVINCPKCFGVNLFTLGVGSENLEDELNQKLPGLKFNITTTSFLNEYSLINPNIPNFDFVGIANVDSILYRPDFRANEKTARYVSRLSQIANMHDSPFIIQTTLPQLPIWKIALDKEEDYYKAELEERELLHYPPFWRILKIVIQNSDSSKLKIESEKINEVLRTKLKDNEIEIIGPYLSIPYKIRTTFRLLIIIKFVKDKFETIKLVLRELPDSCTIDIDTNDILR